MSVFTAVRRKWRAALNLDGPWLCVRCHTWTVVRTEDGGSECINCELPGCTCDFGGWDGPPITDPDCAHHGAEYRRIRDLENRAKEITVHG